MTKEKEIKKFTRKTWVSLLKRDLIKIPSNDGPSFEYTTPKNLIIRVNVKLRKNHRTFIFGGPIYYSIFNIKDKKILKVEKKFKINNIKWETIESISFLYSKLLNGYVDKAIH